MSELKCPKNWGNGYLPEAAMLARVAAGDLPPEMSDCPECGACPGANIDCGTCVAVGMLWERPGGELDQENPNRIRGPLEDSDE